MRASDIMFVYVTACAMLRIAAVCAHGHAGRAPAAHQCLLQDKPNSLPVSQEPFRQQAPNVSLGSSGMPVTLVTLVASKGVDLTHFTDKVPLALPPQLQPCSNFGRFHMT